MVKKTAVLLIFTLTFNFLFPLISAADELEEVTSKLETIKKEQQKLSSDIDKISKDIGGTQFQINDFAAKLDGTKKEIGKVESALQDRKGKLDKQEEIRNARIRTYYKDTQIVPLSFLFGENGLSTNAEQLAYQQAAMSETKYIIGNLNQEISVFEQNKKDLEEIKKSQEGNLSKLNNLRAQLARQRNQTQSQLGSVETEIKALSARQQQLLAEKIGSFTTSVGDVPLSDDDQHLINPGFSPAFAAFSFGAPHRVGMSQYGAYGRALAGQNFETILKAYYADVAVQPFSLPATVSVAGHGTISLEDQYLKGISEMPRSWHIEALKAQAVAARTFVAKWIKDNGGAPICTTEACQVYDGGRVNGTSANDQRWYQAIAETRGTVITQGGQPITAWYASTAGGILRSSADVWGGATGWAKGMVDTETGSIGSWPTGAYEGAKYGKSPWFYKAWYKARGSAGSTRPHAWLRSEEMADILNCVLLYSADRGTKSHLSQTDKPNGDTWSGATVRDQLSSRGITPISSVTSVGAVNYNPVGYTGSISFNTNLGNKSFNGGDFKEIFSIRAPGEIYLASSLYNVENK
jgi:peptidoglycan hydrolase-like amidase